MLRCLVLSLFLIVSVTGHAQNMSAKFTFRDKETNTILPGDIFEGLIQIMPHDGVNLERYKNMVGKNFIEYFYTVSIDRVELNPNNADVLDIYGSFVAKGHFPPKEFYIWNLGSENLPVEIQGISVLDEKKQDLKDQKYIIANQDFSGFFEIYWSALALLLLIVGAVIIFLYKYIRRSQLKKKAKQEKKQLVEKWHETFVLSTRRHEYEQIYQARAEWLDILGNTSPDIENFFNILQRYQYMKEWSDLEESEVKSAFDLIRKVFGQKYGI